MIYFIDHNPSKCDGCLACVEACGQAHRFPAGTANCRIIAFGEGEGGKEGLRFAYVSCMQCRRPRCAELCPTAALRLEGEVVIWEEERCVGCLNCVVACPWGIPVFNEKTGKVSKCDLCVGRLEKGEKPYCVEACPREALALKEMTWEMKHPFKPVFKKFSAVASLPKRRPQNISPQAGRT